MTAHACQTLNPDCHRCGLNIDEMRTIKRRDYAKTTRIWARCEGCRYTWQWNGRTEDATSALRMISGSACGCGRRAS